MRGFVFLLASLVLLPSTVRSQITQNTDGPFLIVLGIGQDAGVPQTGYHAEPGWTDVGAAHTATCLGLVYPATGQKWMFEATPDYRKQWYDLETTDPSNDAKVPDGIFLTHAHIGHYTGLMFLGKESIGAQDVSVYAMPQMVEFLELNGPWDQLVRSRNIRLRSMGRNIPIALAEGIRVIPFPVPHREEYSEVVGFRIEGPSRTALFIPDIDSWEDWDKEGHRLEGLLQSVDIAFVDGTFYADGEIPGRDMSTIPHPMITHTMSRLSGLPAEQRTKIHFIHLNHTNPALDPASAAADSIRSAGFNVARPMDRFSL